MVAKANENIAGPSDKAAFAFVQMLAQEMSAGKIEIPAFPDVAVRIRQVLADDNCNSAQVAKVVSVEPGMTAKLLQMANSAALNPGGSRISELKSAIARIGFANVRTASLAYAMEQIRAAPALVSIRQPLSEIWERSISVAAMSFVAARRWSRVSPDKALLAGLMHGVGKVYILARSVRHAELFSDPAVLQQIMRDWHCPVAKAVLESWEISPDIVEAVEQFEQLDREGGEEVDLVDVLTVADRLVELQSDPAILAVQLADAGISRRLGLTQESCAKVLEESAEELASLHSALRG
jgi:HD-like signal output (HDOD) protein